MTDSDGDKLDRILDKLLDSEPISKEEAKDNQLIGQLQQLIQNFAPPKNDFKINDLIGNSWGEMQIQEVLGQGGMGVVYLAYDTILDRQVALKVLNGFALNYMDSELFVNEAKLMAQVRHPHIMAVFGAGIQQNIAGYWGELLTGQTVEEYLIENPQLNERHVSDLCIQLVEAVQAIHSKGLVHGDIKSNNVIIESDRGAVLMDFGTSFDINDSNAAWFRPSTPLAMAPEQFNGEKPTQASDIFSLGVLFHLLVTGQYPYSGSTYEGLKTAVLKGQRNSTPKQKYNRAYNALINQMLCHEPEESPNAKEVLVELQRIRQIPLQKAKNRVFAISTLALLALTVFSLFLVYTTKQSTMKLTFANTQTEAVNDILTDIIVSPSDIRSGKDVLVKDMVERKLAEVKANTGLSGLARNRIYRAFSKSFSSFGDSEKQTDLLQAIIDSKDSDPRYLKSALIDLADIKNASREYIEAEKLLSEANSIHLINKEQQIKSEIEWHVTYVSFYDGQQEAEKALEHSQKAVDLWKTIKPHFDASVSYSVLGNSLLELSRYTEAKEAFEQCIDIAEKFEKAENYNVFVCKSRLASTMAKLGDYENAIDLNEQMLLSADTFLGKDTAELFLLRMNYSAILANAGQVNKSLMIKEQLLEDSKSFQIPEFFPSFLNGGIAYLYVELERYDDAERLFETTISELTEFFSAKHPYTLSSVNNLSELYYKTNRAEKAINLLTKKIPISEISLGKEHSITLEMRASLAWSHHLLNNHKKAIELITPLVKDSINVFGKEHDFSVEVLQQKQTIEQAIQATEQ